ncbi:hypothetical protein WICPIJ_010097 [Wickerhamomyces pijperi]|uniref:Uncharacterized protein n=1 Tax=Wickerhamomyces pijperi TaxID=599730 RepID=A0A9P8PHQ6_WICPI|nr:hypothetical protein WICPIJ_010097 [Wickerhamomyces pijperi]
MAVRFPHQDITELQSHFENNDGQYPLKETKHGRPKTGYQHPRPVSLNEFSDSEFRMFPDDTVIHNTNGTPTAADFLKYKQQKSSNSSYPVNHSNIPSLTRSVSTAPTFTSYVQPRPSQIQDDNENSFENIGDVSDGVFGPDFTQLVDNSKIAFKYNLNNNDFTNSSTIPEIVDSDISGNDTHLDINNEKRAKNMGPTERRGFSNDGNTLGSEKDSEGYKATSFTSLNSNSSPLPGPSLKRSGAKQNEYGAADSLNSRSSRLQLPHDQHSHLQTMHMITPIAEGMDYDQNTGKWVYSDDNLNLNLNAMGNLSLELNPSNKKSTSESIIPPVSQSTEMQNFSQNTTADELANMTTIRHMNISYTQTKRNVIDTLNGIIKPKTDWETIIQIDISGHKLDSVAGLSRVLPSLRDVNLEDNDLSDLHGLNSSLTKLDISRNHLDDKTAIFDELLPSLEFLKVDSNHLGSMRCFELFKGLKHLSLSGNIIRSLVSLQSVEYLNVSNNELSGELDFRGLSFPNLTNLILDGNRITKISNMKLHKLRILSLTQNTDLVSIDKSNDLTGLKRLNLMGCYRMCDLNVDIFPTLKTLCIEGTINLHGELKSLEGLFVQDGPEWFNIKNPSCVNINLRHLVMPRCGLSSVQDIKNIHRFFPNLVILDLENNKINGTIGDLYSTLKAFKKIENIQLGGNVIKEQFRADAKRLRLFDSLVYSLTHRS